MGAAVLWIIAIVCITASAETYYVNPSSSNTTCPEEGVPCYTLSQYASKPNDYFASNTSLILLPGNHSLDSELRINNITFLSVSLVSSNQSSIKIDTIYNHVHKHILTALTYS